MAKTKTTKKKSTSKKTVNKSVPAPEKIKLKVKKLHPDAVVPHFAHPSDAAMDLYSIEDLILRPNYRAMIGTGISMEFPEGYAGLIWDKSGYGKAGIKVLGGVADAGYRGEYKIMLINLSSENFEIKKGQKIAQILIQKVEHPEVEEVEELSGSSKGNGGFGSTGLTKR